jgi:hypothetical protein
MFPIKYRKPDNGYACKYDVVELVQYVIVNRSTTEEADPTKHPDRYHIEYIFVKHIRD